jgi:flavin-dependent dehydrogenase
MTTAPTADTTVLREPMVDVLIIGAGPSGTVAAGTLRRAGLSVRILEKESFPRFVIGESLLPRCMDALEAAGLLEVAAAAGFQQKEGAKFLRGDEVGDFSFADKFTPGPATTWQVTRADFDRLLADEVERRGAVVDFGCEVTAIAFDGPTSTTTFRRSAGAGASIHEQPARFVIDASGYGRVLPRLLDLDQPSGLPPRQALFAHFHDDRRAAVHEPTRIQIISHAPGFWAWVIPFSNGLTSVGFVGSPERFAELSDAPNDHEKNLRTIVEREPNTRDRFRGMPLALPARSLAGWSVKTKQLHGPGYALTGNVAEFLDPIFSSGVTLAMVSGHRAAELASRQLAGAAVDWESEFTIPTRLGVDTFRAYVNAWYDGSLERIIYAKNPDADIKRKICAVLAGYVWDEQNPFVKRAERALAVVARAVAQRERAS